MILARYSFNATLSADLVETGLAASACTNASLSALARSLGLGYTTDPAVTANPPNATTNLPQAIANNSYFSFTLTPAAAKALRLNYISLSAARGGAATTRGFSIRSSVDNYASDIVGGALLTQRSTFASFTGDLTSQQYQDLSAPITFRVYIYAPTSASSVDLDEIIIEGAVVNSPTPQTLGVSRSLTREIAEKCQDFGLGIFEPVAPAAASTRTIWVGELPESAVATSLWLVEAPSPPPHNYIDTEYTVIDFWARSPDTEQARSLLEMVFNDFHRRYGYETRNWHIYFSRALGSIVDVDRDAEGGKLFRLSVQFICRNLNNLS